MEAALRGFDPLAVATGHCFLLGGAQIRRGGRQEGQAPCTGQHPQDARDLPTRQHATREEEDGGMLGGKTVKNAVGGEAGQGRCGSGQQWATSGQQQAQGI